MMGMRKDKYLWLLLIDMVCGEKGGGVWIGCGRGLIGYSLCGFWTMKLNHGGKFLHP